MANAANLINFGGSGGGGLRLLDRQVFTASGTWTKPADNAGNILAGTNKVVFVRAIGGGGGGISGTDATYSINYYAGGSGAGTSESTFDVSQVAATVTITVGAAGTASSGGSDFFAAVGGAGGNSSFGSSVFAEGGLGAKCQATSSYPSSPASLPAEFGAWDVTQAQYFRMGGAGSTAKGSRGAFLWLVYNSSTGTYTALAVPAEKGPGCGGGAAYTIAGSPSGYVPIGSNSTVQTPGPGGTSATAGGLYGGGGGAAFGGTAYAGAAGVVVVETWG